MLTLTPPHWTEEEASLMTVGKWWSERWTKTRGLLLVVAVMQFVGAFTLTFAPHNQLFTQGARPAFALFPPVIWAALFLLGGLGAASLLHRFTGPRQFLTWLAVIPTQAMWITASALAVLAGRGGAMSMVFLPALLAFTVATALLVVWDYAAGKR